ncbi:hypothetical protein SmJEL517_g00714 [Synchytrium microbalum]|uniref:GRIP domain-containing protein n=1 Tax=Synchytrium microbalum TaxID=1806994 RepID=A0A507CER5_9FUNG|nr:uncharacterized protein SmJEL517_g00714 [Synchytrium microbalum]TPX37679.1 hypothetical protein SmJEL517_g00714 [Synchytrium microbalum]
MSNSPTPPSSSTFATLLGSATSPTQQPGSVTSSPPALVSSLFGAWQRGITGSASTLNSILPVSAAPSPQASPAQEAHRSEDRLAAKLASLQAKKVEAVNNSHNTNNNTRDHANIAPIPMTDEPEDNDQTPTQSMNLADISPSLSINSAANLTPRASPSRTNLRNASLQESDTAGSVDSDRDDSSVDGSPDDLPEMALSTRRASSVSGVTGINWSSLQSRIGSSDSVNYGGVSTSNMAAALSTTDLQAKLTKLKKYESKFTDLAKAYKALQSKVSTIESVLAKHTPVKTISNKEELSALEIYLQQASSEKPDVRQVPPEEMTKLKRQLSEMKEIQQLESQAKNEMFGSLQAEITAKNEEIAKLKVQLELRSSESPRVSTTTELQPESPPPSAAPSLSAESDKGSDLAVLKQKLKEMATALRKVTDQRNKVTEDRNKANETIEQLKAENSQLKSAAPATSSVEKSNDGKSMQELEAKLKSQQEEHADIIAKSESRMQSYLNTIDELQLANASLKDASKEFESRTISRIGELEARLAKAAEEAEINVGVKSEFARTRRHVTDLEAQIAQLRKTVEDAEKIAWEKAGEADEALAMKRAADDTLRTLHADAQREAGRASALQMELDSVRNEMQDMLNKAVTSRDDALKRAKDAEAASEARDTIEASAVSSKYEERMAELAAKLAEVEALSKKQMDEMEEMARKRLEDLEASSRQAHQKNISDLNEKASSIEKTLRSRVVEIEQELVVATTSITKLQADMQTATRQHDESLSQSTIRLEDTHRKAIEQLSSSLKREHQSQLETLQEELNALKEDMTSKEVELTTLRNIQSQPPASPSSETDAAVAELNTRLAVAEKARADAVERSEKVLAGVRKLNTELKSRREEIVALEAKLKDVDTERADLTRKVEDVSKELVAAKADVESSHSRIESMAKASKEAESMHQIDKEAVVRHEVDAVKLHHQSEIEAVKLHHQAEIEAVSIKHKATISEIQAQLKTTQASLQKATEQSQSMTARIQTLEVELSTAKEDLQAAQRDLTKATEEVKKAHEDSKAASSTESAFLQESLQSLRKQLDTLAGEKTSLEAERDAAKQELAQTSTSIKSLEASYQSTADQHKSSLTEMETRLREVTEALALAKREIHTRDESLAEQGQTMAVVRQALAEEEEKKNKSIQLLRNSKQRIIKLETDVKDRETELEAVKSNMNDILSQREKETKERETQMAHMTRQVEDMSGRLKRQEESLREMDKKRREATTETERLSTRVAELASLEGMLRREKEALNDQLRVRGAELESAQTALEETTGRLSLLETTAREIDDKSTVYESELETSRRLFQTKSVECDAMRLKISELEAKIYDATQISGRATDEVDNLRRELSSARRDNGALASQLKAFEEEVAEARRVKVACDRDVSTFKNEVRLARDEIEGWRDRVKDLEAKDETWKAAVQEHEAKTRELGKTLSDIEKRHQVELAERDKVAEDVRMRESQLRNVNKALKEEVRKLSKNPTNNSSPPPSHRSSLTGVNNERAPSPISSTSTSAAQLPNTISSLSGPSFISNAPQLPSSLSINPRRSIVNSSPGSSPTASNAPHLPMSGDNPNQEYLKNIILKFVEFKDKRSQLVQVLALLLRFSPDELKRIQRNL